MKVFTGRVVSVKNNKTAAVVVENVFMHPIYKKRSKRSRKYHVHTETNVQVNDIVRFVATKPYSKLKKWRLIDMQEEKKGGKK